MKAVIFGSSGQDGHYLGDLLRRNGVECVEVARSGPVKGDVQDRAFVEAVLKSTEPQYIFHFAATSTARHDAIFLNHDSISTGTLNILEAARTICPSARIFLSGSALQFKNDGKPIDESTPFEASSPYAVSRIHSAYAGRYFRAKFGMKVYIGYFFNHDSPLRTEHHINQKIAQTAIRIAKGNRETLEIGDLNAKKEFNFAGDIVEAVWLLINQDNVFEAVLGSGQPHSIEEWVSYCFRSLGMDYRNHVIHNKSFVPEYGILVSNPATILNLGWRPKVGFEELADLMLQRS